MRHTVDFTNVSTAGLESSPVAEALAGLRANEARYFKNKYDHEFTVGAAADEVDALAWVTRILADERDIVIASRPLEVTSFEVEGYRMAYAFYESGLSINVMYGLEADGKRAVGFKLSEGMEIPKELATKYKFARQKSKLAGVIRGSYFVIKNEYELRPLPRRAVSVADLISHRASMPIVDEASSRSDIDDILDATL